MDRLEMQMRGKLNDLVAPRLQGELHAILDEHLPRFAGTLLNAQLLELTQGLARAKRHAEASESKAAASEASRSEASARLERQLQEFNQLGAKHDTLRVQALRKDERLNRIEVELGNMAQRHSMPPKDAQRARECLVRCCAAVQKVAAGHEVGPLDSDFPHAESAHLEGEAQGRRCENQDDGLGRVWQQQDESMALDCDMVLPYDPSSPPAQTECVEDGRRRSMSGSRARDSDRHKGECNRVTVQHQGERPKDALRPPPSTAGAGVGGAGGSRSSGKAQPERDERSGGHAKAKGSIRSASHGKDKNERNPPRGQNGSGKLSLAKKRSSPKTSAETKHGSPLKSSLSQHSNSTGASGRSLAAASPLGQAGADKREQGRARELSDKGRKRGEVGEQYCNGQQNDHRRGACMSVSTPAGSRNQGVVLRDAISSVYADRLRQDSAHKNNQKDEGVESSQKDVAGNGRERTKGKESATEMGKCSEFDALGEAMGAHCANTGDVHDVLNTTGATTDGEGAEDDAMHGNATSAGDEMIEVRPARFCPRERRCCGVHAVCDVPVDADFDVSVDAGMLPTLYVSMQTCCYSPSHLSDFHVVSVSRKHFLLQTACVNRLS